MMLLHNCVCVLISCSWPQSYISLLLSLWNDLFPGIQPVHSGVFSSGFYVWQCCLARISDDTGFLLKILCYLYRSRPYFLWLPQLSCPNLCFFNQGRRFLLVCFFNTCNGCSSNNFFFCHGVWVLYLKIEASAVLCPAFASDSFNVSKCSKSSKSSEPISSAI